MNRYEAALSVLLRRKIVLGGTITLGAVTLKKTRKGSAGIFQGIGGARDLLAGIAGAGQFLPLCGDGFPKAELTTLVPETEEQKAALADVVLAYIRERPECGGSQYDPTCAAAWAQYRADLAALKA